MTRGVDTGAGEEASLVGCALWSNLKSSDKLNSQFLLCRKKKYVPHFADALMYSVGGKKAVGVKFKWFN